MIINGTTHALNADIAKVAGVNAALIYERIRFYCEYHETNDTNFIDGHHWCYNTYSAWSEQFPFLTERQVRTAIQKLEREGLIKVGNHNKKKYDKTKWYTVLHENAVLKNDKKPLTQKSVASDTEVSPSDIGVRPIPEYTQNIPTNTTHTNTRASDKHIMFDDWEPDKKSLERCREANLNEQEFQDCLEDFIEYWKTQSRKAKGKKDDSGWQRAFRYQVGSFEARHRTRYRSNNVGGKPQSASGKRQAEQVDGFRRAIESFTE